MYFEFLSILAGQVSSVLCLGATCEKWVIGGFRAVMGGWWSLAQGGGWMGGQMFDDRMGGQVVGGRMGGR